MERRFDGDLDPGVGAIGRPQQPHPHIELLPIRLAGRRPDTLPFHG
ncbi:MAG: hypothetical protein UZ18_ATM001000748, partial [Armatimonadetes bacterium OLB18]